jgi:hypothetical protein
VCALKKCALLGRDARAFAVGDALVGRQGCRFAFQRQLGGLFAGDVPGVEQVEVGVFLGDVGLVGQAATGSSAVKRAMS